MLTALVNHSQSYVGAGVVPARMGNRHPSIVPYESFAAADGEVVVAVGNDRQFARLCAELGVGELARDARFATNPDRVAHRDALLAAARRRAFAVRAREELASALNGAGVPCGPVNDLGGAFALAERLGLHEIVEMAGRGAPGRRPDRALRDRRSRYRRAAAAAGRRRRRGAGVAARRGRRIRD